MKMFGFILKFGVSAAAMVIFVAGMNFMAGVLYSPINAPEKLAVSTVAEKPAAGDKKTAAPQAAAVEKTTGAAPAPVAKRKVSVKRLYRVCSACHERPGRRNKPDKPAIQDYPGLYGQDAKYMEAQVKDIISGKRAGGINANGDPRTAAMKGSLVAPDGKARITPAEIKLISKWLSEKTPLVWPEPETPVSAEMVEEGKALYKKKNCRACHGKAGRKPLKGYPFLAGQKQAYLTAQMIDIKTKARTNGKSKAMYPFVKKLEDAQLDAIAAYLSIEKR